MTWRSSKSIAAAAVIAVPVTLILRAIGLYMPSLILKELESGDAFWQVVWVIAMLAAAQMIFSLANQYMEVKRGTAEHFVLLEMIYEEERRERYMDYYLQYDPELAVILQRAQKVTENNHTAGVHFIQYFGEMLVHILSFVLFGTIISTISPWILMLLLAGCLANYGMGKWQQRRSWESGDERNLVNKKLNYIAWTVSNDLSCGKDIRLFHFGDFLGALVAKLEGRWYEEQNKVERNSFLAAFVGFLVVLLRDGAAYAFLIARAVEGEIDAAQFVLYFAAITQLSEFVSGILGTWGRLWAGALGVSDYREFFDIKDRLNRGTGIALPEEKAVSIEFRNVSYQYPTGEKKVLDHVSFHIRAGEKIALVGANGAGKTTMTMLMCGLLVPDEGEVLINGHSVYEYNRDELYSLFSLVPQKCTLLPSSLAENITIVDTEAGEAIDYERLNRCIKAAGLADKIHALPKGVETPLNRQVNEDATELSGGELQKLLLARAMYRGAKVLILDEPTAALDPIAEDAMYRKYNDISKDTTSIFISHRLASTRFCDRIFFLDDASIAEEGTHKELMAKGGKYRALFEVQAKYYKDGGPGGEKAANQEGMPDGKKAANKEGMSDE
ncbi:MAG: ABC transporter ATP-binding protein [Lachnospiraceae bacterium]|nr:ABC transporter ATP-binding protein [Lachnospiraceae bacterium]